MRRSVPLEPCDPSSGIVSPGPDRGEADSNMELCNGSTGEPLSDLYASCGGIANEASIPILGSIGDTGGRVW